MKIFNVICICFVKAYRVFISPFFPGACRFSPTCSQYTIEAFNNFGFFKALWLSINRILKCHPYHPGGYDPIPTIKE